jgi:hypothetical protein
VFQSGYNQHNAVGKTSPNYSKKVDTTHKLEVQIFLADLWQALPSAPSIPQKESIRIYMIIAYRCSHWYSGSLLSLSQFPNRMPFSAERMSIRNAGVIKTMQIEGKINIAIGMSILIGAL